MCSDSRTFLLTHARGYTVVPTTLSSSIGGSVVEIYSEIVDE